MAAYCTVHAAKIDVHKHEIIVEITIKNIGKATAADVYADGKYVMGVEVIAPKTAIVEAFSMAFGTIDPSATRTSYAEVNEWVVDERERPRLLAHSDEACEVAITLHWRDTFGRKHTASHRLATRDSIRNTFTPPHTVAFSERLRPIFSGDYKVDDGEVRPAK